VEPYEIAATGAAEFTARRAAMVRLMAERGLAACIVTDQRDLQYLIGYRGTTPLGPNPFAGSCSSALVLGAGGEAALVCGLPDPWMIDLAAGDIEVRPFDTFGDLTPIRPRRRLGAAVAAALTRLGAKGGAAIGYEASSWPVLAMEALGAAGLTDRLVDVEMHIASARMRKSESELAALRQSIAVCDSAQRAAADAASVGTTRDELHAVIRQSVEEATGTPTPILIEASYGANFGADSADRPLRDGDLLVVDIAPRVAGYWGDSCSTHPIGEVGAEQQRLLEVIREALALGTAAVRPGVPAGEVDAVMRSHVATSLPAYDGSGGHGIGLDFHEPPRLMPGEETALEEDMVIALEPGVYLEHACGRVEHLVRVVPGGCEILSQHLAAR
jgi:Xaa-Pro aminopeptidase